MMTLPKDYSGQRYGRLVALNRVGNRGGSWRFKCDCGNETVSNIGRVRLGVTQSCGCIALEALRARSITHGHSLGRSVSPTLGSYRNAKARCYYSGSARYAEYGGRGIKMCDRWLESFDAFLEDMGERPVGMTLDRIDLNGDYEPSNCRWATADKQSENRRNTILVAQGDEQISLRRFAMTNGVPYKAIHKRVLRGQEPHAALAAMKAEDGVLFEGQRITLKSFAEMKGINYKRLHSHMKRHGMSHESAAADLLR